MYTTHHIFRVLPIRHLVNQDSEPTTAQKLETGMKPTVLNIRVLCFSCVVQRATEHVDVRALTLCCQLKKGY